MLSSSFPNQTVHISSSSFFSFLRIHSTITFIELKLWLDLLFFYPNWFFHHWIDCISESIELSRMGPRECQGWCKMNDNSLVTPEIIYWLGFPNNLPKWKTQILWVSAESNITVMFVKKISYWKSLQYYMVKFRNSKPGEARGIKSKAKYGLQMCWVMSASSAIFWVLLLVCPASSIQSHTNTGCRCIVADYAAPLSSE